MKYLILSLLYQAPTHGYDLLQRYEELFRTILAPLNAGQVYTTLGRLERDGFVRKFDVEQEGKPDKRVYEITSAGQQALQTWLDKPLSGPRVKDSFYLKLVSAQISGLTQLQALIGRQRGEYLVSLHDLNNLALQHDVRSDPARLLLIQGAVLHLKADLEWLDLCEETFSQK